MLTCGYILAFSLTNVTTVIEDTFSSLQSIISIVLRGGWAYENALPESKKHESAHTTRLKFKTTNPTASLQIYYSRRL